MGLWNFSSLSKDLAITAVLAVIAFCAVSIAGWVTLVPDTPSSLKEEITLLKSRDIVNYTILDDGTVAYTYRGEPLPQKIVPDEVVERRTASSYSRLVGTENKGTPQEKLIVEAVVFSQETFLERAGGWYYLEHGETTLDAFDRVRKENPLAALLFQDAHAASVSPFSGAGDGFVEAFNHDAATGDATNHTNTTFHALSSNASGKEFSFTTYDRGFVPFNTSSIPASATVTAATLNLYVTAKTNGDTNDALDYITVVQTSQASETSLATADFDQCGSISNPTEGVDSGQRKDISSISTGAYLVFTLNSTGRGWIKKSGQTANCGTTAGFTCLGVREGHDTTNTPTDLDTASSVTFSSSEHSLTSQDPFLSVTYVTSSFVFWQFQDF